MDSTKTNKVAYVYGAILIAVISFLPLLTSAQNSEAEQVAENQASIGLPQSGSAADEMASITQNFLQTYGINERTYNKAKALKDIILRADLEKVDTDSEILIKQGSTMRLYKLFAREQLWAAKYEDSWGFVPMADVMQVMEEKMNTSFSPYDTPPKMKSNVSLKYPEEARKQGIQGDVVFSILVDKNGDVKEYVITKSIPELDEAATSAIKEMKFKPGKYQDKPVEVWMRMPVSFRIKVEEEVQTNQ